METTETQNTKPKTSKLAIAALITPVALWLPMPFFCIQPHVLDQRAYDSLMSKAFLFALFIIALNFTLSLVAFIRIKKSHGFLKGYLWVILSLFSFLIAIFIYYLVFISLAVIFSFLE